MAGVEWLIEAFGCQDSSIRQPSSLEALFQRVVSGMNLHPVGDPVWHEFPRGGGVTGIWLLQESHLTIHTFPEYRSVCMNVFCCKPRPPLDWQDAFARFLGATNVHVQEHPRLYRMDG